MSAIVEKLTEAAARHTEMIYETADYIWAHPETGYREWNTTAYLAGRFEALGYTLVKAGDIPGFYADLDTGRPGPKVAVLGELDSLIVGNHPDCDPATKAVHACGHNCQSAILLGVAAALKEPGALDGLCGSIRLISVPAEELIELGYRKELRDRGVIRFLGGKVEFIARGYFDGVDIAMMIHAGHLDPGKALNFNRGSNGCVLKNITYHGLAAHAGGSPERGHNALYAANLGINAVNALRETFVDGDHVRFHPIITEGGAAVNAIPETARLESYVRGANYESIAANNEKINRALAASAAAIGCTVTLEDAPGYMPLQNDRNLAEVMAGVMRAVAGPDSVEFTDNWGTGSTDMGDVSAIIPAVHPHCSGSEGMGHGADYRIVDKRLACLLPAQCLAGTVGALLENEAAAGRRVVAEAKPRYPSKEAYLEAIERFNMKAEAVSYEEDGSVRLTYRQK
ncbi:MAG: amidohydrolase [Clostridia bacterium]|nr:amidohydrolase [Clostridia bacterium]